MTRKTKLMTASDPRLHRPALEEAAQVVRSGGLVAFPTETVYGLGANALDGSAVAGIFIAKDRPQDNPLIVHVARLEDTFPLVAEFPPMAHVLAQAFWPGPLTIILRRSVLVPDEVSAGLDTVAVRMPSHPVARALITLAGVPMAAPSANLSGSPSPTTAEHCFADLGGRVDIILDGGRCQVGVESTVITLATPVPRLLRPGAVTLEELRAVLGDVEVDDAVCHHIDAAIPVSSPGMKYKHYAPGANIVLIHGELARFAAYLQDKMVDGVYALAFDGDEKALDLPCISYGREDDSAAQAEELFAALRRLDELGARQVYARACRMDGVGLAVYNRLVRAAAFEEIYLDG